MITPNLDATQYWWIYALARFMFSIEYQKGHDNVATDDLSSVTSKLDVGTVKSILDGVTMGTTEIEDAHDLVVAKADKEIHNPAQEMAILAGATCIDLHVTNWVTTQQEVQYSRWQLSGSRSRKYMM